MLAAKEVIPERTPDPRGAASVGCSLACASGCTETAGADLEVGRLGGADASGLAPPASDSAGRGLGWLGSDMQNPLQNVFGCRSLRWKRRRRRDRREKDVNARFFFDDRHPSILPTRPSPANQSRGGFMTFLTKFHRHFHADLGLLQYFCRSVFGWTWRIRSWPKASENWRLSISSARRRGTRITRCGGSRVVKS